jgi:hypothetical protein
VHTYKHTFINHFQTEIGRKNEGKEEVHSRRKEDGGVEERKVEGYCTIKG